MSFMVNLFQIILEKSPPLSLFQQAHEHDYGGDFGHVRPCRACTDFKTWVQTNKPTTTKSNDTPKIDFEKHRRECPLDKDELGRNSWSLFHTMSVYYPEKPTTEEQELMKSFIKGLAKFYPCETCRKDFQADIQVDPPNTESRSALCDWWCRIHNRVNKKLGKQEFDCSKLTERWLDGWSNGSCD